MLSLRENAKVNFASAWKYRWHALAVAWLLCVTGWTVISSLPNIYAAKARIYVDADSMLRPLLRGIAADPNIISEVDLMQRTLLSRPNLEKVTHMADLNLKARTRVDQDELIASLQQGVIVTNDGKNLFALTYSDPDPQTAKKVVESLVGLFVDSNLGNSRKDLIATRNFLDEQIADYRRQLSETEKRLAVFKSKNAGFLPGEINYGSQLEETRADLESTDAEIAETIKQKEELTRQMAAVPKVIEIAADTGFDLGAGPPLGGGPLDADAENDSAVRIAGLKAKIKDLLLTYTESYPDVVAARRQLAQAEDDAKKAREEADQEKSDNPPAPRVAPRATTPNPLYDQLKLQQVNLETKIASLQSRKQRKAADIQRLRVLAQSVPEVGVEMTQLMRDYEVVKRSYEELLNRREAARIGENVQSQTQAVNFRIIDPPEVAPQPVGPRRALFMTATLFAGLLAGIAFALGLGQIDDTVRTVHDLRGMTTLPILGSVTVIHLKSWRRKQALSGILLTVGVLGLFGVYLGWLVARGLLHSAA